MKKYFNRSAPILIKQSDMIKISIFTLIFSILICNVFCQTKAFAKQQFVIRTIADSSAARYWGDGGRSSLVGFNKPDGNADYSAGNIFNIYNNHLFSKTIAYPVPLFSATASAGKAAGTTEVTATMRTGYHILIKVSSSIITIPNIGDEAPAGIGVINNYISGADISGIDESVNKYLGVYEVDSTNKVVSFNCLMLTNEDIKPAPPIITSPIDGTFTKDNQIIVSGSAKSNSTVYLNFEDDSWHIVTADKNGNWSYKPQVPIMDGVYYIEAKVVVGNSLQSDISNQVYVTIDTKVPSPPVITEPTSGMSLKNQNLIVFGFAEDYAKVNYYINGIDYGYYILDKNIFFGVSLGTFQPGTYSVTAIAIDRAGNKSALCNAVTIIINAAAPSVVLLGTPCNGFTTSNNMTLYSGITDPNATVYLVVDNVVIKAIISNADGYWGYNSETPLADGNHSIVAVILVNGKNIVSNVTYLAIDTFAEVPIINAPINGAVLNDKNPTIIGKSEPNALVYIYVNNVTTGISNTYRTYADSNGIWSFALISLDDGKYTISAKIRDIVSNISEVCNPINLTIDTKGPNFTMEDVNIVKNYLLGKSSTNLSEIISKEDVDGDGKITSRDYSLILKYVSGQISNFPNVNK
jgi:hypothetical protein